MIATMIDEPRLKPIVYLIGNEGNAFALITKVKAAMLDAGQYEEFEQFIKKTVPGSYHNLLSTVIEYCEVE